MSIGGSDRAAAASHLEKAREILAENVAKDPANEDFRRQWAFTHLATSRYHLEVDEPNPAIASALEGIRIEEALVADSPENVNAQNTLALLFTPLGAAHAKQASMESAPKEPWQKARETYGKSLAVYLALKEKGKLSGADATKPDDLAREIALCEARSHKPRRGLLNERWETLPARPPAPTSAQSVNLH